MLHNDRNSYMELQNVDSLMPLETNMLHFNLIEFLVVCGSIVLVAFLLTEILDWSQLFSCAEHQKPFFTYGYANHNGPHTWRNQYPECEGENQSPVNLATNQAVVVNPSDDLLWLDYDISPFCMNITNDGHTVLLTAQWHEELRPLISGGPLKGEYDFHSLLFHWGPSDEEGSEHTLDNESYAMELQMVHIKRGFTTPIDAIMVGAKDGLVILSFLVELMPVDNPLLDHVVNNLWRISVPGNTASIPPFPLNWVYPPFCSGYYTYSGSLTQPPCSECVTWIIQPEALAISRRQLAQFRKLSSEDGPMFNNSRPVQELNGRDVYFYD